MNDQMIPANLDPASNQFKAIVEGSLQRIEPGVYGTKLSDASRRLWTKPAVEAMVFGKKTGTTEIYTCRRALDDTAYPGEWHAPGKLHHPGEQDGNVANRLEDEFGVRFERFELVGKEITNEARGTVHSMIFVVQLAGDPDIDDRHDWFPVNDLPQITVDVHRNLIIPAASQVYWQRYY